MPKIKSDRFLFSVIITILVVVSVYMARVYKPAM